MKRYLVSVWTRQSYTQWVEAESEEEANGLQSASGTICNQIQMITRRSMRPM